MQVIYTDQVDKGLHPALIRDYLSGKESLRDFYKWKPEINSFTELIKERQKYKINREVLTDVLKDQLSGYFSAYPLMKTNVDLLKRDDSFTITTGHQICIATGPLYFIYKIISAINLASELKLLHPDKNFIPVYWMATEDHDFKEISELTIGVKSVTWAIHPSGAAGRVSTEGIGEFISEIENASGVGITGSEITRMLRESYTSKANLADATRDFVLKLFGKYGLVIIDPDHSSLKRLFIPVIKRELEGKESFDLVNEASNKLKDEYSLPVTPREINLFYLDTNLRERIVEVNGNYQVQNTEISFTSDQVIETLNNYPEKFSPNVVLRPVYQECILPNLAYIGGPGESAYWLQLKSVFDLHGIFYPMVLLRNHALILNEKLISTLNKLKLEIDDLFKSKDELVRNFISGINPHPELLSTEYKKVEQSFQHLSEKIAITDPTLKASVLASLKRTEKEFDKLRVRINRALKKKNAVDIRRIEEIKQVTFPGNIPQERVSNVIPFIIAGPDLIDHLVQFLKPLDHRIAILITSDLPVNNPA